jgi:hypothetical protein
MQQANLAHDESGLALPAGAPPPAPQSANSFVINLCSSTTPVALSPPDHAGLKRFIFFVSRRREEGRERFRLHMGYFASQEEAEKLLDIVREIYPGAWAGLAPGHRLRTQAPGAARVELPTSTPVTARSEAGAAAAAPAAAAIPPAVVAVTPTAPAPAVTDALPAAARAAQPEPTVQPGPAAQPDLALQPELALLPDAGRRLPAATLELRLQPTLAAAAAPAAAGEASHSLGNVRAAIASLEEQTATAPTLRPLPELKAAPGLSESGVLRMLEGTARADAPTLRQPRPATPVRAATLPGSPQRPATERLREVAEARARDEKAQFAVQLMWSVQPIDISQVPQLAIFSAYTLYGAEGNRDGRRWYGIRLGFFTDAVSAKQVAHYVRSDFATVSVVPVTVRERERARLAATRPPAAPAASPSATERAQPVRFEFIDDTQRPAGGVAFRADGSPVPAAPGGATPGPATPARPTRGAPGKRAKLRPASATRVQAKAKAKPMTLEETLEILGASELQIDDGRKALINDSGVRHLQLEAARPGKPSRLGKLFEKLAERLGT